ncbi:MAG: hypothetical protein K6T71_07140 [Candidatus Bipolaricaulota bacterium]|nr:hypothetical protein [Candidatus Bipolaricaulota bacterium]
MLYRSWGVWKWAMVVAVGVSLAVVPSVAQVSTTINIIPSTIVPFGTPVFIQISGVYKNGCVPQSPVASLFSATITINTSNPGTMCTQALTPWGPYTIGAGILPPGTYLVRVIHNPANAAPELLGSRTFVVVPPPPPPPSPPPPPAPAAIVCDPGAPAEGLFLRDGARYLATGGTHLSPDKRGADHWADLSVIDSSFLAKWQAWGKFDKPFESGMNDDGDWVVYRVAVRNQPLAELQFCLKAVGNRAAQVEVFVQTEPTDPAKLPAPDGDIRGLEGWTKVGTLTAALGSYQLYSVPVGGVAASAFYNVALRLEEEMPDGNVIIAWLKLRA